RRPLPARHRAEPPRPRRRHPRPRRARGSAPVNAAVLDAAGSVLLSEIREQPAALERLLEHAPEYDAVAAEANRRGTSLVRIVGHGSSDNAASFGIYAFGLLPGWTALRDSISLSVYYGAALDLGGSTVVALSQSGATPDVVEYVQLARKRGAYTIGITNDVNSPLAEAAVAAVDALSPVYAGAAQAGALPAVVEACRGARSAGATVVASGPAAASIADAAFTLPVPHPPLPLLGPLLSIVPGQLLAW